MKNYKAVKRLINSVWTVEFKKIDNMNVEIVRYSRSDEEGYRKEKELPQGYLLENDQRIAQKLMLNGVEFNIINKQHVFSY